MRGRNRNKGPNPLTRSYESNGPDVKVRGTAQHIADKYAQLARDAQASSDPVAAENYLQHAEHYYRLIAAAQEQFRQQYGGSFPRPFDDEGDEGDDEAGAGGFGYGDRPGGAPQGASPNGQADEFGEAPSFGPGNFGQGGFEGRPSEYGNEGGNRQGQRFDRYDRQERGGYDRPQGGDRNGGRYDRNGYDRGGNDRGGGDRPYFDRNAGGERGGYDRGQQDRGAGMRGGSDRGGPDRGGPDRGGQERGGFDRGGQDRGERRERYGQNGQRPEGGRNEGRGDGRRDDRVREFGRQDRGPRTDGPREAPRSGQIEAEADEAAGDLPAFLTTPVRTPVVSDEPSAAAEQIVEAPAALQAEGDLPAPRPRRRRTRRTEEALELTAEGAGSEKGDA